MELDATVASEEASTTEEEDEMTDDGGISHWNGKNIAPTTGPITGLRQRSREECIDRSPANDRIGEWEADFYLENRETGVLLDRRVYG